jgi:hypothetical protein
MSRHIVIPTHECGALSGPLISVAPVALTSEGRAAELQVRITAPMTNHALPLVVLSHGHGPSQYVSSLYGGELGLGGISGYEVAETTDENLPRAAMVMRMTAAFLRTQLGLDSGAWTCEVEHLSRGSARLATVHERS